MIRRCSSRVSLSHSLSPRVLFLLPLWLPFFPPLCSFTIPQPRLFLSFFKHPPFPFGPEYLPSDNESSSSRHSRASHADNAVTFELCAASTGDMRKSRSAAPWMPLSLGLRGPEGGGGWARGGKGRLDVDAPLVQGLRVLQPRYLRTGNLITNVARELIRLLGSGQGVRLTHTVVESISGACILKS